MPIYREIALDLDIDPARDEMAAHILADLLRSRCEGRGDEMFPYVVPGQMVDLMDSNTLDHVTSLLKARDVLVVGAGLRNDISVADYISDRVLMTADGATTPVLAQGVIPDVVVTDLDSKMKDIMTAGHMGAVVVVHAHGDNIDALREWVPRMSFRVVGTCQVVPPPGIFNFGGFTDGDRAVVMADHLGARSIALLGFDFNSPGPYSYHRDPEIKMRKLRIARRIIGNVMTPIEFFD